MHRSIRRASDLLHKALEAMPRLIMRPGALIHGLRGVHLREYLKLDRRWLRRSGIRTVLDVGANTGQFASAIAALLPDARIYAFEPLPDCYEALRRRMRRSRERFEAFPFAIGDVEGAVTFHRSSFAESSSVLPMDDLHKQAFPWTAETVPLEVEMRTLDEVVHGLDLAPDVLLKIDVQGYEHRVLVGAARTLPRIRYVITEVTFEPLYRGQGSAAETCALLSRHGFQLKGVLEQLACPMDDRILQADLLFARE